MRMPRPTLRSSDASRGRAATSRFASDFNGLHLRHEALLTLVRKIQAAADDGDAPRLEQTAELLLDVLTTHIGDEAGAMTKLSPSEARILRRGKLRLLAQANQLIRAAADGCSESSGRCVDLTEEMLALLTLQARDERFALQDPAA
ncbi:MAG: hypothetical protein ACRDYE_11345 [Acidimicrobiales bacterium]